MVNKRYLILLVLVAKRKSLFDDKGDEIQQLTFIIKQDLGTLNKQIAQLQEVEFLTLPHFVSCAYSSASTDVLIIIVIITIIRLCHSR